MHECEPGCSETDAVRCLCGSLVARRVERGIELKCRRCKRTIVVPLSATTDEPGAPD